MAINIKNAEVDDLIQRIRQLTGLGPTEIVKAALEREYQEIRRQRRQVQLAQKLPSIQVAAQAKANDFASDALYDETGLPQ
ncbi:type II toxin-antitoxin system VapB family antitoxin [Nodosilinea sp. LEGE 07088]|uniref:type II toxin-antitoxin system VapB family antitoxin n=1 Tax=Nodosilinea sp. LEGE 07088 TaxID=2777968 RepID=UPI001881CD12|nr:type II toxin-antitoxin system VapB family antitoxin [Nodosilinea sp. LEGE 07088]MBE9138556.1 type II toxin-antitoxin system VapB family antitoxin [Nodosilinea sp. LEGE 07088]